MKNLKKRLSVLVTMGLCVAMTVGLAACGNSGNNASTDTKTLTVQLGPTPETIDPALNSAVDGGNYILFCYDNLLTLDKDGNVAPGLAKKWETSKDKKTWTFHLRDGLKWSDGSKLTAKDFVYSWRRVADPKTAAPYGETVLKMVKGYKDAIGNPDDKGKQTTKPDTSKLGVVAKDDKTLVVTLNNPCSYFDQLAAFTTLSPVKESSIKKYGDKWSITPKAYVTSGAFYVSEYEKDHITFKKNPNYWNASAIKLETIKAILTNDTNAAYTAYQSGKAQMIKSVPTDQVKALQGKSDFHVDKILGTYYISLNHKKAVFKDAKVREALSLAIDRNYISKTITNGVYSPANTFVPSGVKNTDGSDWIKSINNGQGYINNDTHKENLEKAKKLLAEAGHKDGKGIPTITYSINDDGYHKKIGEYLQQAWKQLGINLKVDVVEWQSFLPQRRAGNYDSCRNGWVMDYNDPSNILELLTTTNGNNDGKYANRKFDAMIEKAANDTNNAERNKIYHQAEDMLMKDTAMIPLLYYNDFYLQNSNVTGSWHGVNGYWYFQYASISK